MGKTKYISLTYDTKRLTIIVYGLQGIPHIDYVMDR